MIYAGFISSPFPAEGRGARNQVFPLKYPLTFNGERRERPHPRLHPRPRPLLRSLSFLPRDRERAFFDVLWKSARVVIELSSANAAEGEEETGGGGSGDEIPMENADLEA